MPKTLPERIFFTIVMAAIMVYGMIVYNVALNTGGVTNATFVMALHEMPIMVPIMCPVMSLIATVLFKEPGFGTWVHTWGCNMPMALCWQLLYCGPLARAIFRVVLRRSAKQAD